MRGSFICHTVKCLQHHLIGADPNKDEERLAAVIISRIIELFSTLSVSDDQISPIMPGCAP